MTEWYHKHNFGGGYLFKLRDIKGKSRLVHYDPDGIKYVVAIQKILKGIEQYRIQED